MLALAGCCLSAAAAPPAVVRRLPPEGIDPAVLAAQLDEADRQAWESVPARLALLRQRLGTLALDDKTARAEIEVFFKAVDHAAHRRRMVGAGRSRTGGMGS